LADGTDVCDKRKIDIVHKFLVSKVFCGLSPVIWLLGRALQNVVSESILVLSTTLSGDTVPSRGRLVVPTYLRLGT